MRRHIRPFIARHEPPGRLISHLKSGSGAVIGMTAVGGLAAITGWPLLIAPFGATAVLVFGVSASPLAQPINVIGGYLLAAIVGAAAAAAFPGVWWAAGAAVGVAIALMLMLRVTHPPAGAIPLIAAASPLEPMMLFLAVLIGSTSLVALAFLHHRLPPRQEYPRRLD